MMAGSEKKRQHLTLPGSQPKTRGQNVILRCLTVPKREPYGGIISHKNVVKPYKIKGFIKDPYYNYQTADATLGSSFAMTKMSYVMGLVSK